jgi:indolepyruvate ferredoxin oxidoreductase alpha subunit
MDLLKKNGEKVVLLGNEAIARGAIEAGVGLVSCYPGTPSSEVGVSLAALAKKRGFYFEWATNEKVATEVAASASFCGVKSLTAMKSFGMNVASDSFLPLAYTGVKGGMVVVVADDPMGHSSAQSEQDSRYYSMMGNFPMLEPSNPQECKDFTIKAFEISKKFNIPVILRTTTMVSHSTGTVVLGKIKKSSTKGKFVKNKDTYFSLHPHLQELHKRVLNKINLIEKEYEKLNKIEGKGKIGIITNGVSYNYVKEISPKNVKIAKLSLTNPISKKFVTMFLKGLKKAIVVEELDPVIEKFVKETAFESKSKTKIYGKNIFPRIGEFTPEIVLKGLLKTGIKLPAPNFRNHEKNISKIKIPSRKPVFCNGCPHNFTYKAVKEALGNDIVWAGDIGCYSIGILDPYNMQDFIISMGASQGMAHGIKKASKQKVVAFIGDSTFFHAGISGLTNILYNHSNPLIIIMDNSITAMTGHEPNPGTGFDSRWNKTPPMKIEDVVKGMGIKNMKIIDPINKKEMIATVKKFITKKEPSVIISRRICAIFLQKALKQGILKPGEKRK